MRKLNVKDIENQRIKLILKRLYHTLTYEGSTVVILAGYKFIGYGLLLTILSVTAILYSPYLIKTLFELKKWRWIIAFVFMIVLPVILLLLNSTSTIHNMAYGSISLFMFYFFCWILKFNVYKWMDDVER
jgi:hypothetical protein